MHKVKKQFWLYILKLEQNKYYIGITAKSPEDRFKEHKNGFMAARWTKKYKPLKIIDTKDLGMKTLHEAEAYENKVVRRYMKEKGYNNALTDEQDYIRRFGWYVDIHDYETLTVVLFLMIALFGMGVAYYLK